jgi:hypothetical protein
VLLTRGLVGCFGGKSGSLHFHNRRLRRIQCVVELKLAAGWWCWW